MFPYTATGREWKIFVREQNLSSDTPVQENSKKYMSVAPLTGDKAKEYYENLLSETSHKEKETGVLVRQNKPIQTKNKDIVVKTNFKDTDLLWMAQNNDIKNLEKFFSQTKDHNVDVVDDFAWTPLMCAACSGAEDAVKILLENNANPLKCDKSGNTALQLAIKNNRTNIVNLIIEFFDEPEVEDESDVSTESPEPFFCVACNENFKMNKKKHDTSTLHLFNSKIKTSTFYGIPECNKGFQLLLKEGWNKEKGLGPKGIGRKFPIKAVMKKDRKGIGAPETPAQSNNKKPEHTRKYENNKIRNYNRWKEKNFERNFRLQFL